MEVLGNFQQKYRFEMNAPNYNYSSIQIYGLVVFFTYFVRFLIMLQLHHYLILLNISVLEIHFLKVSK